MSSEDEDKAKTAAARKAVDMARQRAAGLLAPYVFGFSRLDKNGGLRAEAPMIEASLASDILLPYLLDEVVSEKNRDV